MDPEVDFKKLREVLMKYVEKEGLVKYDSIRVSGHKMSIQGFELLLQFCFNYGMDIKRIAAGLSIIDDQQEIDSFHVNKAAIVQERGVAWCLDFNK